MSSEQGEPGSNELPSVPVERMTAQPGRLRAFIFENGKIGLEPGLYYELDLPLAPFDSGIPGDSSAIQKKFRLHFLPLPRRDWRALAGASFQLEPDAADGSIYLGDAHNPVDITRLTFNGRAGRRFDVELELFCDFAYEAIARSARVKLSTHVEFEGLRIVDWMLKGAPDKPARARQLLSDLACAEAYDTRFDPVLGGFAPLPGQATGSRSPG